MNATIHHPPPSQIVHVVSDRVRQELVARLVLTNTLHMHYSCGALGTQ